MTISVYSLIGYAFAIRFLFGETLTVVMQTGVAINTENVPMVFIIINMILYDI